ncbi:MAG: hypothetical protein AAGH40_05165 [Verrucomicrobiota bacterium]
MKLLPLVLLAIIASSGCSPKSVFKKPNENTYVWVRINHKEGSHVSAAIKTIEGKRELNLSGKSISKQNGFTNIEKRKATFRILESSKESFLLGYDITFTTDSWESQTKGEERIRFDQSHHLFDLPKGYNFTIDLKLEPVGTD